MARTSSEIQSEINHFERQISDLHVYLSNADGYSAQGYRQQISDFQQHISGLRYELKLALKDERIR